VVISDAADSSFTLTLRGFEDITLGAGNDLATGSGSGDTLGGGAGNDTITGGAGGDRLIGGSGNDTFIFAATDSINTALDSLVDLGTGDQLRLAARPTSSATSAGADLTAASVASTGVTAASLATDLATAVAAAAADAFDQIGDTLLVTLTGTSLAGTGVVYIVQNQAANATYDATADTVIALIGGTTPLLASFVA
jgi:Ca2+-binding RTX toxin-like protein